MTSCVRCARSCKGDSQTELAAVKGEGEKPKNAGHARTHVPQKSTPCRLISPVDRSPPFSYPTWIRRGLVSSRLLSVIVSTPSLSLALTDCSSTVGGRVKLRRNRE